MFSYDAAPEGPGMALRIYADRSHYSEAARPALNDILKALWNDKSPAERRAAYGRRADLFAPVATPADADLVLLAMKWNHYVDHGCVGLAVAAAQEARRAGRPFVVFSEGDFTAHVPIADAFVFEKSAYRSRGGGRRFAMPAFFGDLAPPEPGMRRHQPVPVVGFCGQAGGSRLRVAGRVTLA